MSITLEADLEVTLAPPITLTADLDVGIAPPITLTADLDVGIAPPITLEADLHVQPLPDAVTLTADLSVKEASLALLRREPGGALTPHRIFRREEGVLVRQRLLRRIDGQLYPRAGELPPPPVTWRKPLIGAGGGPESTQYTPLNTAVGPMLARRSYDSSLPSSFATSAAASDVAAGRHSYWSWKPDPINFKNSAGQQAAFSAFLDTIPVGHKVTIFCHHEPENNMSDFGGGLGGLVGYGQLQDVVANLVRAKNRPDDLRFGPCFMGPWTWDSRGAYYTWINEWQNVMDWSKFDVVGIDPYSTTHPDGYSLERILTVRNSGSGSGATSVQPMLTWLAAWDIPIVIAEWGYFRKQPTGHTNADPPVDPIPDAVVAAWITEAYAWFKTWNEAHPPHLVDGRYKGPWIDAALYFNYTLQGSCNPLTGPLTSPTTSGPRIDAYSAIVADSKIPVT